MLGADERKNSKKEKLEEEIDNYLLELLEAKIDQAELRFKSSKYWIFKG